MFPGRVNHICKYLDKESTEFVGPESNSLWQEYSTCERGGENSGEMRIIIQVLCS